MAEPDPAPLARRLRQLRESRWPDRRLTQQQVAEALGVALSSVSSWENTRVAKIPPPNRLADYASLFATPRSFDHGQSRLLRIDDLTEAERGARDQLVAELEELRLAAAGSTGAAVASPWRFEDGGPVRIICGLNPDRPPHASARHHNYMQLAGYADLDSLVELFGHVRSQNPDSDVRFDVADRLEPDDAKAHLVVLGGLNRMIGWVADRTDLPVVQVPDPSVTGGEVFRLPAEPDRVFGPRFNTSDEVIEDVGLFFRAPNPFNSARTLTLCSGVFTRGVYGAVRILTDLGLREENQQVLRRMFGDESHYGLLMRVPVLDHATITPDLRNTTAVHFSWPGVQGVSGSA